ncbi:MAG TPA: PadR family transcriptional regulator [Candidatus Gemmiger avium]|nr:PadR family transcriptional regulator [Candidatus Gemmiger avium]
MAFNTGAALMDALVLSIVAQEPTYGYKITQEVRAVMVVSESTLYPVLRRLQKDGCLDTYDQEFAGRNRRYYRLTEAGRQRLADYRREWRDYRRSIDRLLLGEEENT